MNRICLCGLQESEWAWEEGDRACPTCNRVWPEALQPYPNKYQQGNSYLVWRFHEAPEALKALSTNGGDEDWLVLHPVDEEGWVPWIEAIGICSVQVIELPDGRHVSIGSHA